MNTYITKANGEKELFDPEKLRVSLRRTKASESTVDKVVDHILQEITENITTTELYKHAFEVLKREDRKASVHYSLRKAVMDLGPSGFPFEQFIAQIFVAQGFQTETGVEMMGECVSHEVDVVAWNDDKLIIVEAKFHNQLGVKSDLKVALYIKARFDDLSNVTFNYGKERKIDEGWLVTNTKFSKQAIQYAECKKMKLVGWNYPEHGNLQDLIVDAKLQPITCLTVTTQAEERALAEAGIVLCKQAKENLDIVRQVGIGEEKIKMMLQEIESIQI